MILLVICTIVILLAYIAWWRDPLRSGFVILSSTFVYCVTSIVVTGEIGTTSKNPLPIEAFFKIESGSDYWMRAILAVLSFLGLCLFAILSHFRDVRRDQIRMEETRMRYHSERMKARSIQ